MTTAALQMNRTIWAGAGRAAMLPLGILLLVVLMVVPIAPFLLDMFFILNIMIALAVLMVSLNTQKPLDFSSFPTVLLFATLLRQIGRASCRERVVQYVYITVVA